MSKINEVYEALVELEKKEQRGITAAELSSFMNLDRANVSRYLNVLFKEKKVNKVDGRPVIYISNQEEAITKDDKLEALQRNKSNTLDMLVGAELSLQVPIQQAKAAILYPPRGLHTLILGETGVGKSLFAESMYCFAKDSKMIDEDAPFIRFNCADYADNPQLVMAQIFGVKKGAYTGADSDKDGLLKKAHGGILFLDEIHRLSPQGQEMLFTYIDKGFFRPLGDTEKLIKVEAQIIAATTEDPGSFLLKTFTRRIPMTITLPPLKERSIKERYYLLEEFIRDESKRVGKSIYFNKNALISFLLYDCPNNIGQLRSDIQLSCAKAFLNYKAKNTDFIIVEQGDLQQRVNKGLMKISEHREDIEEILSNMGDILRFSYKDDNKSIFNNINVEKESGKNSEYFYDIIEEKLETLKKKGLDEEEINQIINIDIESYFKKYISNLPENYRKDEIAKIVDGEVVDTVEEILTYSSEKLERYYDEKVYVGLALHLQGSLDRIRKGNSIFHPKINFIRSQYSKEFFVAMEVAQLIEKKFNIQVPLDEIGYITMFLAAKPYEVDEKKVGKVGVLVIMHGHSTASSMVEVANTLIGEECAEALDMPLSMKAEQMYEMAKSKIIEMDNQKGVLLLVDMGSLTNFGDMIKEETGVNIKTIDLVSTLLVIEAGRKALNGRTLESIYESCLEMNRIGIHSNRENKEKKSPLIITTCFTGEGSAERLKEIVADKMKNSNKVLIKSLDILNKEDFIIQVNKLKNNYNILAIVGTINVHIEEIPFISAPDILAGDGIKRLDKFVDTEDDYAKIAQSMDEQLKNIKGKKLVSEARECIAEIEERLSINMEHDIKVGIVMHICFLVDKILNGNNVDRKFENLNEYRNAHSKEFILVKQSIRRIEMNYDISIGEYELANLVKMVVENSSTV